MIAIGEGAATMDAELRPLREQAHERIRAAMQAVTDRLDEAQLLRPGLTAAAAAATLYAVANDTTYLRMTDGSGLPPKQYATWLATTLESTLLDT